MLTIWSDRNCLVSDKLIIPSDDRQVQSKADLMTEAYVCYAKLIAGLRRSLVLVRLGFSGYPYSMLCSDVSMRRYTVIKRLIFILDFLSNIQSSAAL